MKKVKKILLIGGEGFIGRNIASVLSDFDCYSLGTKKSIFLDRKDSYIEVNPYIETVNNEFDVYIHLIDNKAETDFFQREEEQLMRNIKIKKNKHLIVFSSAVIYSNMESPYAKRKIILENFYEKFCSDNKIKLTIFRLFNTYGEYQIPFRQGSLVANIVFNYINSKPIEIKDLDASRDFMYVKDVGKVTKWVIENNFYGKVDLATGELTTVKELLKIFKETIFKEKYQIVDKKEKEVNICPVGNSDLFNKVEKTSLEDGLIRTYKFYKDNINIINTI